MNEFDRDKLVNLTQDILKRATTQGADSAFVAVNEEDGFSVTARSGDVENIEHHKERSMSINVYCDQCSGSASTSDFSNEAVSAAVEKAINIAKFTSKDEFSGLPNKEDQAYDYPDLDLYHPWAITPHEAIDMAVRCESIARMEDKRIKDSEGASVSTYNGCFVYANTNGFAGGYPTSRHSIACEAVAEEHGNMQRDYEYTTARSADDLIDVELLAKQTVKKTVMRLGARKIKTQQCPVLFHSSVARGLIGNFISAISGSKLYRKTSFLLDYIDKVIFPEWVNIYQRPHLLNTLGSAAFDGEGVTTKDQHYVENGILKSYVLSSYSARKLGLKTTGNSGGVFNLTMQDSKVSFDTLLKNMGTGLLVTELFGQGVNILTGDYSKGAFGYWIENGEIQFPVEEITIAGSLPVIYKSILAVGNDVDTRGSIRTGSILVDQMMVAGS